MSAQDRTLDQYQQFMRINAASHLFRSARELGLLKELREGQRTLDQICETLSLRPEPASLIMDGLVATSGSSSGSLVHARTNNKPTISEGEI